MKLQNVHHCRCRREQLDSAPGTPDDDAVSNGSLGSRRSGDKGSIGRSKRKSRLPTSASKLNFGDATDDVHVCIMCLRAIMNHQVRQTKPLHTQPRNQGGGFTSFVFRIVQI